MNDHLRQLQQALNVSESIRDLMLRLGLELEIYSSEEQPHGLVCGVKTGWSKDGYLRTGICAVIERDGTLKVYATFNMRVCTRDGSYGVDLKKLYGIDDPNWSMMATGVDHSKSCTSLLAFQEIVKPCMKDPVRADDAPDLVERLIRHYMAVTVPTHA